MFSYSKNLLQNPEERTTAGTITSLPAKGQKSDPLKYSDIPVQIKARNRRVSSARLARQMERAGGQTTEKGRHFAAVLEERAINPNLQRENPAMARISNNSLYKSAMWSAFECELEKLSFFGNQQQPYAPLGGEQLSAQKEKLRTTGITSLGGAVPGAIGGGVLGSAIGASMGKGFSGSVKGALIGGTLLGLGGGYMTMNATRKDPLVDTFKGTAGATPPPTRIS